MMNFDLTDMLGKAFAEGQVENFAPFLAKDCTYLSEYADNQFDSAEEIIKRMKYVFSNLDDTSRYTYSVVRLDEISDIDILRSELGDYLSGELSTEYGLYLHQGGNDAPVAVVLIYKNDKNEISGILLSRNRKVFGIRFHGDPIGDDSPYDLPSTVIPMTSHDRQVKELRRAFSGQHLDDIPKEETDNLYIWRQADIFIKDWLKNNGYYVMESKIRDDCIGYRCTRNGYAYTVYMYAYGQKQTSQLDGAYCEKLGKSKFSENSTVLIVYLNVKRFMKGGKIEYKVCSYCGSEEYNIELWQLTEVNSKPILVFYPRREMMGLVYELMYAFNHDSLDVYDCIITEKNPKFYGYDDSGFLYNAVFYRTLKKLHEKYGDMKLGYVRYNDVVYSSVP